MLESNMSTAWIVVANGGGAKIIDATRVIEAPPVIQEFSHPDTAKRNREFKSDRPGRTFESGSNARHAMEMPEDPTDHQRKIFAKKIVDYLDQAHSQNRFQRLVLVVSPIFLGNIRNELSDKLRKIITHEVSKDLFAQELHEGEIMKKILKDLNILRF